MTSKASCPLPCSAHLTVVCSVHCDGLTNHHGNEVGVAVESFIQGADGADAVADFCGIACSPKYSAACKQHSGGQLQRLSYSLSGEALELVLDELSLDNYSVTCGMNLKLK